MLYLKVHTLRSLLSNSNAAKGGINVPSSLAPRQRCIFPREAREPGGQGLCLTAAVPGRTAAGPGPSPQRRTVSRAPSPTGTAVQQRGGANPSQASHQSAARCAPAERGSAIHHDPAETPCPGPGGPSLPPRAHGRLCPPGGPRSSARTGGRLYTTRALPPQTPAAGIGDLETAAKARCVAWINTAITPR